MMKNTAIGQLRIWGNIIIKIPIDGSIEYFVKQNNVKPKSIFKGYNN
jgi:hypothetical protein